MQRIQILLALILSLNLFIVPSVLAAPLAGVTNDQPVIQFLNTTTPEEPVVRNAPPIGLTLAMLGFCCIFLLLLGVIALGFFIRIQNQKEDKNTRSRQADDL